MNGGRYGGSLVQQVLTAALILLLAAWAITEAMQLIVTVWVPLAVLGAVVGCAALAIAWWRSRRNGW